MVERISSDEMMERGRSRGVEPLKLFVIFSSPTENWDRILPQAKAHVESLFKLEEDGTLFAAGPLGSDAQYFDGEGMIIVRAESMEEAEAIAARDPMHSSGARTFRVRPWFMMEGTISVAAVMSSNKGRIA